MAGSVVLLEHGVQDAFDKADLVRCVHGSQLGRKVASGVDQRVDAFTADLVEGTSDLIIERRNGMVGRIDETVQVRFRDIFGEMLSFVWSTISIIKDLKPQVGPPSERKHTV